MTAPIRAPGAGLAPETRGMLGIIFAFLLFAGVDTIARHLTGSFHPVQVVWARYASQMVLVIAIMAPRLPRLVRTANPGLQLLRSGLLFAATLCFFNALSLMKLAEASALLQTAPLLITALAPFLLGESVGIRRWTGVVVGLFGALIIIQPGAGVFQWAALLPLGAASFLALYQIATRMLSGADSIWTTVFYTAGVGALIASVAVPWFWTTPTFAEAVLMLGMGLLAGIGHLALVYAMGQASASALAPFNYSQLVWAALLGLLFLGEWPKTTTIAGAAVIVSAGLYVWHRERVRARA
ncbi:MAG: DMT family transporter [Paracoccaceae bacterium]|nr:DMT family transporter [Paracoccaceae bacterium]